MPPEAHITSDSDLESVISLQDIKGKRRRNSTGAKKYICSIKGCGASFKRLTHLDRHEYKHTGIRKHVCTYDGCNKSYTIITHLKRHLRTTHERAASPQKKIPCNIDGCDKLFQSTCNMHRHMREVHENPKVYFCSHCHEKFTQKLKLRRHEITQHTGEYPYSCIKCAKGFYQRWQYERHLPTCKIYPCSHCELQFEKWSLYLKHCKDAQHGKKHYACENCDRTFSRPSELQHHVATSHLNLACVDDSLPYKCTHDGCDRRYAYERNLKQHTRIAHGGQRYHCTEENCDRLFSSTQNLNKHLQREHNKLTKEQSANIIVEDDPIKETRRKRHDAGQPLISSLSKLSCLAVNKPFDKLLREREEVAIKQTTTLLEEQQVNAENLTESDEERNMQPNVAINASACFEVAEKQQLELDELIAVALQDE